MRLRSRWGDMSARERWAPLGMSFGAFLFGFSLCAFLTQNHMIEWFYFR